MPGLEQRIVALESQMVAAQNQLNTLLTAPPDSFILGVSSAASISGQGSAEGPEQ